MRRWSLVVLFLSFVLALPAHADSIIGALPFNLTNGTTADASQVMANFNTILNGTNTNAAANGVNSSITHLTGLTTPLSISQGGCGATSVAGCLTNLGIQIGTQSPAAVNITGGQINGTPIGTSTAAAGAFTTLTASGDATFTTQSAGDISTKAATTAFVNNTALTLAAGTTSVTQSTTDDSTLVATDAFVKSVIPNLQHAFFGTAGTFTFTTPATTLSTTIFKLTVTGGGASGGDGMFGCALSGGPGGGTAIGWVTGLSASTGYTITVGSSGASSGHCNGGGNSSAVMGATTLTGLGGPILTSSQTGGGATGGTINLSGGNGNGFPNTTAGTYHGGFSYWGQGGEATTSSTGCSPGVAYGTGGSSTNGLTICAGAAGAVLIEWSL